MDPIKERRSSRSKTTTAQRIVTLACGGSSPDSPINGSPSSRISVSTTSKLERGVGTPTFEGGFESRAQTACLLDARSPGGTCKKRSCDHPLRGRAISQYSGRHACFSDRRCCGGREVDHFKSQGRTRCPTSMAGAQNE